MGRAAVWTIVVGAALLGFGCSGDDGDADIDADGWVASFSVGFIDKWLDDLYTP